MQTADPSRFTDTSHPWASKITEHFQAIVTALGDPLRPWNLCSGFSGLGSETECAEALKISFGLVDMCDVKSAAYTVNSLNHKDRVRHFWKSCKDACDGKPCLQHPGRTPCVLHPLMITDMLVLSGGCQPYSHLNPNRRSHAPLQAHPGHSTMFGVDDRFFADKFLLFDGSIA